MSLRNKPNYLLKNAKNISNKEGKRMKKLMLLGGSRYALPVIEAAHNLGVYVITCDYLPDNKCRRIWIIRILIKKLVGICNKL